MPSRFVAGSAYFFEQKRKEEISYIWGCICLLTKPGQNSNIKPTEKVGKYNGRDIPGSVAFVPSVAGLILAGEVVKDLTLMEIKNNR